MTQCNSLNVKQSNPRLNKLKSVIKNEIDVLLRLSSNRIGNSNDETNSPHKLLLPNRKIANLRKAFANYTSIDIKLTKTQLSKMIQSGAFLDRLLGPLLQTGLPLIKHLIKPLAKSVLFPLGLTEDAGIHKKILGSGHNTTLVISNDEMEDIIKIDKFFDDSRLLLEGVSETIKNKTKEQKGRFFLVCY